MEYEKDNGFMRLASRIYTNGQTEKAKAGDFVNKSKFCVECGDHVPAYQKFYCEECWEKALKAKLEEDDAKETVDNQIARNKNIIGGQ